MLLKFCSMEFNLSFLLIYILFIVILESTENPEGAEDIDWQLTTEMKKYELGKRWLATMMGEDVETFTDEKIAVSYNVFKFLFFVKRPYSWLWSNRIMYFFSGGFKGGQVGATAPLSGRKLSLVLPFYVRNGPLIVTQRHSFVIVSIRMWGNMQIIMAIFNRKANEFS